MAVSAKFFNYLKLPDGTVKVLVEGIKRVKILEIDQNKDEDYLSCDVEILEESNRNKDSDTYAQSLVKRFEKLLILNKRDLSEVIDKYKKIKRKQ